MGAIKLGELLNPHRHALKVMIFYAGVGTGAGLFSIGVGVATAKYIGESMEAEELFEESGEEAIQGIALNSEQPNACVGCSNYHGKSYNGVQFVCGIYPHGFKGEQCPDYWKKP